MTEPSNQELKELLLSLEKVVLGLDKKIEVGLAEVRGERRRVEGRLESQIQRVESRLEGEI
jgi:hypothetical protein